MPSDIERFGGTMHSQMKSVNSAGTDTAVEMGRINEKLALVPDESPGPIPEGEYSVCSNAPSPSEGQRVLINWCGTEAVIVDVIK